MFIEDIILTLANYNTHGHYSNNGINTSNFDSPVISSLASQVLMNNGFTEKQNALAVKLCKKYAKQLDIFFKTSVTPYLDAPTNRLTKRVFSQERTVKVVKEDGVKYFQIKFPYDRTLIEKFRSFRTNNLTSHSMWNDQHKTWRLTFDEKSIEFILNETTDFDRDDESQALFNQYKDVLDNFKNHTPMLIIENGVFKLVNAKHQIDTVDICDALVQLRNLQYTVMDDTILKFIDALELSDITKVMLAMPDSYSFQTSKSKHSYADVLESVLVYGRPVGIIMNEHASADDLLNWVEAAKGKGLTNEDMGVFFRQENSQPNAKAFNNVIKENKLNKTVNKDLKIYFLGPKYNKSLIKENIDLRYFICDDHYVTAHHNMQVMLTNALLKVYHLEQDKKLGDDIVIL